MQRQLSQILNYLGESQWWPADLLERKQLIALRRLVQHTRVHVPYYHDLLQECDDNFPVSLEQWRTLPLLGRGAVQTAGDALHSTLALPGHRAISRKYTSGSTGKPVCVLGTQMTSLIWRALTIRDHLWHARDFTKKLGVIRWFPDDFAAPPHGTRSNNWGAATSAMKTGRCAMLSIHSTTAEQAAWLRAERPSYLLSYPSALEQLAVHARDHGCLNILELEQIRCFGEALSPSCRRSCEAAWNVKLVDMYSSEEAGYMALQCPEESHYHVMAENLLFEVVDSQGRACHPGQVGRVVVTPLHNFASPLLRYEIGDYAEVGYPCMCGRGLMVLKRIMGRARNMFALPNGQKVWPSFQFRPGSGLQRLPIQQFQAVQRSLDEVTVKLVAARRLRPGEEELIRSAVAESLRHPFRIAIDYVDQIPRSPTGKFEDFLSMMTPRR